MTISSVQTTRRRFLSAAVAGTILVGAFAGTTTSAEAAAGSDTLFANESLGVNQSIVSSGGAYRALLQSDGNFVVYGPGGAAWASNTVGSGATRVTMQGDGNLVMYTASGTPVFATGTNGTGGSRLVMQSDGNLVEYGGAAVWASKNSSERAISWMYGKIGSRVYEGYCERAVENAFGTGGHYASAKANWTSGRSARRTPLRHEGPWSSTTPAPTGTSPSASATARSSAPAPAVRSVSFPSGISRTRSAGPGRRGDKPLIR